MTPERKRQYKRFGFDVEETPNGWRCRRLGDEEWSGPYESEFDIIRLIGHALEEKLRSLKGELRRRQKPPK